MGSKKEFIYLFFEQGAEERPKAGDNPQENRSLSRDINIDQLDDLVVLNRNLSQVSILEILIKTLTGLI